LSIFQGEKLTGLYAGGAGAAMNPIGQILS
jgi:hypothetical protein